MNSGGFSARRPRRFHCATRSRREPARVCRPGRPDADAFYVALKNPPTHEYATPRVGMRRHPLQQGAGGRIPSVIRVPPPRELAGDLGRHTVLIGVVVTESRRIPTCWHRVSRTLSVGLVGGRTRSTGASYPAVAVRPRRSLPSGPVAAGGGDGGASSGRRAFAAPVVGVRPGRPVPALRKRFRQTGPP